MEFTPEDEETLGMFASQAALVIANARRHRQGRLPYHDSFRRRRWLRQAAVAIRIARAASAAGFDMRESLCLSCADLVVSPFALGAVPLSSPGLARCVRSVRCNRARLRVGLLVAS